VFGNRPLVLSDVPKSLEKVYVEMMRSVGWAGWLALTGACAASKLFESHGGGQAWAAFNVCFSAAWLFMFALCKIGTHRSKVE
jgi:hypothetical protein